MIELFNFPQPEKKKAAKKLYDKLYSATHRDEINARKRRYWAANPEKFRARKRELYAQNAEHIAARRKKKRRTENRTASGRIKFYCRRHGWYNGKLLKCPTCKSKRPRLGLQQSWRRHAKTISSSN